MIFWGHISRPKDSEIELGHSAQMPSPLDSYQVVIDPSPPFHIRVRNSIRTRYASIDRAEKKIIVMITLNIICVVYQAFDSYATLYPGSKVAANILLNDNTNHAWMAFFWLFAIFASAANLVAVPIWVAWAARLLRIDRIRTRKYLFCLVGLFGIGIVVPSLILAPFWVTFVVRIIWQRIAWSRVCDGWQVDAVLTGVNYYTYYPNITLVGSAAITIGQGGYTMQLFRD